MKKITSKTYSHLSLGTNVKNFNSEIIASDAYEVNRYSELVKIIAKITFNNPEINIYYRGQKGDHKSSTNKTEIIPTLHRGEVKSRKDKFKVLDVATDELVKSFRLEKIEGYKKVSDFPIVAWSILQHYEVCATPLLDVTDNLLVACSFALNSNEDGYLYLLGLPHSNGSVTYSTEQELFNIKLNSICPPDALRPYYQNGYLIGNFPDYPVKFSKSSHDFSKRLVAKFKLNRDKFWDESFRQIPNSALFPNEDKSKLKSIIDNIKLVGLNKRLEELKNQESVEELKQGLYDDKLKTEVLNLILNDWEESEIIEHLIKRGFQKNQIEDEYEELSILL